MKQMKQWLMLAAVFVLCGTMAGCKGNEQRPVSGTLEGPTNPGAAPEAVMEVTKHLTPTDDRLETVMEDKAQDIAVWSLLRCSENESSEGFGILISKGGVQTVFPQIRHGRMPRAHYDAATDELWIIGSDMEGTGVDVERPYLLHFKDDSHAEIKGEIDPYLIQEAIRKVLTYSIKGQDITFYNEGKELITVSNHIQDMGDFMDDAIYIGEQISYTTDGPLTIHVTPGVNYVTGKVLHYDDMPTFSAVVTLDLENQSIALSNFKVDTE